MQRATNLLIACSAVAALLLAGCSSSADPSSAGNGCVTGGGLTTLSQAGSSTVLPIAEAWAEDFGECIGADIVVAGGGTGAGFQKFCRGEIDISDASRPIKQSESDACKAAGIEPYEFTVAIDGLSVVVSKDNTFAHCLTVEQLNQIWTANATKQVSRWSQLDPSWPNEEIALYGPGTDSGTFDYFREVIIHPFDGSKADMRSDFSANENDNVLVTGIAESTYSLGYFGLAYYEENKDRLNVIHIDEGEGAGCIEPTAANVESGAYSPLARPIFMYTDGAPTGSLKAYFERGFSMEGQDMVEEVGYIRLPAAKLAEMKAKVA